MKEELGWRDHISINIYWFGLNVASGVITPVLLPYLVLLFVPAELKNLCAHLASRTHGCMYCQAHALQGASRSGSEEARLEAVWEFSTSPLFSEAEKAALDFAVKAASVPNGVTDDDFERMREHWDEGQIVEILAAVALYGFLNRFNDSLATPLEEGSATFAEETIGEQGWSRGKHA